MAQIGSLSTWYTNAYSGPFRTTRLRAPSLIPAGRPVVHVQQTLVVDAARTAPTTAGDKEDGKNVRRRETIFGPDVGEDDEPGWTKSEEGVKVGVDVVKGWVERAKNEEGLHATTTLQALVNLKRPTLLLQQLDAEVPASAIAEANEITPADDSQPSTAAALASVPSAQPPLHLLKFNYDATTPLVHISLSIHPAPVVHEEGAEVVEEPIKVVYSGVHEGGFNQTFNLPAEAAIDLSSTIAPMPTHDESAGAEGENKDATVEGAHETSPVRESEDTTRSSIDRSTAMLHRNSTQPELATVPELAQANTDAEPRRAGRRFGIFRRGNREADVEQGQIELENRQAENTEEKSTDEHDKDAERGMRLLIKIEAVGPEGQPLKRRNAQLTHILINGTWVPEPGSQAGPGQAGKRVWVVRVVRREAVIGAHTFLLKEIYGLSSASTQTNTQSTYPPTSGQDDPYASTPNECIVCLTAPRDVVLLPCRHLVVCRECAVGMVEFGAGGRVGRREDGTATGETTDAANGGTGTTATAGNATTTVPPVAGGTTATGRERRKKKPKGWYCPVCRQPYTSLLRLALPTSAKPLRTPAASRMASRAPSVRSFHTSHSHHDHEHEHDGASLRRVPSIAPTLPDGAERMLDSLRPAGADGEDDEDDEVEIEPVSHDQRPQFVLASEVEGADEDDLKGVKKEVEHREVVTPSPALEKEQAQAQAETEAEAPAQDEVSRAEQGEGENVHAVDGQQDKKGWKEVA